MKAATERGRQARRLCGTCDVRTACALWGIHHENWGIWGGLSEHERRDIRRRRGIELNQINHPWAVSNVTQYWEK